MNPISVAILLNEREQTKRDAAVALAEMLHSRNISASRLTVTPDSAALVIAAKPAALVVDYLLGDFTTGVDLLEEICERLPPEERPLTFFLTDEPSVQVAVQAMRLGASHYLLLEGRESLHQLIDEIEGSVRRSPLRRRALPTIPLLDSFRFVSRPGRRMVESARTAVSLGAPIVVLLGPNGSGRATLARAMNAARSNRSPLTELTLPTFADSYEPLVGLSWTGPRTPRLGRDLSLLVRRVELDEEELFRLVLAGRHKIWPNRAGEKPHSFLYLTTDCEKTADRWVHSLDATVIHCPALHEREQDVPFFLDLALKRANSCATKPLKAPPPQLSHTIAGYTWPGDVEELISVVAEALISSQESGMDLEATLKDVKESWEYHRRAAPQIPRSDTFTVLRLLHEYRWNLRQAAARLGLTAAELRTYLEGSHLVSNHD